LSPRSVPICSIDTSLTALKRSQSQPDASDTKRIAELDKSISKLSKEHSSLDQKAKEIRSSIGALQEKILEVGGVKLRAQQSKVDDIKAMIDHTTDRLTKAEVGKAKAEKDAAKLEKSLASDEATLQTLDEELADLEHSIKENAAASELVRKEVEKASEVLVDKKEELAEMKGVLDEKQAVINRFRAREVRCYTFWEMER
jgi:structural maintenance of chromosome 4